MALSGVIQRPFADYFRLQIEWTATQSQSNNTSTITSKLYLISESSQATINTSSDRRAWCTIAGNTSYSAYDPNKLDLAGNQKKLMHTHVRTVGHDSNGNLTVSLGGGIDWNLNINGWTGSTVTISGTGVLNNIPQEPTYVKPKNVTITYPTTRTTFDNSFQLKWTSPADPNGLALQYEIAYRNKSSNAWTYTSLFTNNNSTKTYNFDTTNWVDSTTAQFAVRSRNSQGLFSSWIYTPDQTVKNAVVPLAATALTPNSGGTYPPELNTRFTWQLNGGTGQSRYILEYRKIGVSTWTSTGWVNTSRTYHDLPANTLTAGQYEWRIGHTGTNGLNAPWSALQQFEILEPTTAPTFVKPEVNEDISNSLIEVQWNPVTNQEAYQLVMQVGGGVVFSETVNTALNAGYISYNIEQGAMYTINLRVKVNGVWSPYATRNVVGSIASPDPAIIDPETFITTDENRGSISLSYTPPENKINLLPSFTSGRWNGVFLGDPNGLYTTAWTTGYDAPTYIRLPARPNVRYYAMIEIGPGLSLELSTYNSSGTELQSVSAAAGAGGTTYLDVLTSAATVSIEFRIEGGTNYDQFIEYPVLAEEPVTSFSAGSDDGFTNTAFLEIQRKEFGTDEWITISQDIDLSIGGYEDNTVASGILYEYRIVSVGTNGLLTMTDAYEAQVRFMHAFLHEADNPQIFFKIDLEDAREEQLDVEGELKFFAGRRLPVREYGVHETHELAIEWVVDTPEELADVKNMVKQRKALLYRDNAGRRFFATTNGVQATDRQISGHNMSMVLIETDFKEGVS